MDLTKGIIPLSQNFWVTGDKEEDIGSDQNHRKDDG